MTAGQHVHDPDPDADNECEWCGTALDTPRVFCDSRCERAWDKAQRQRLQAGLDPED